MASDINKNDDTDQFWSFLNGDDEKEKIYEQAPKEVNRINVDYDVEFESLKKDIPEISKQNQDQNQRQHRQSSNAEFDLTKALKAIEDIEAFGTADDDLMSDDMRLELSSEEEDEWDPQKNGKEEKDVWENEEKDGDEAEKIEERQNAQLKDENEKTAASTIDSFVQKIGLDTKTLYCGGIVAAIFLSLRLLFIALGRMTNLLHQALLV